jgi:putative transposase
MKDQLMLTPLVLGATAEQRQEAYRALFRAQFDPETLAEVRTALNGQLITGTGRFKTEIEAMLGRRVQPAKRGRPRKQVETELLRGEAE